MSDQGLGVDPALESKLHDASELEHALTCQYLWAEAPVAEMSGSTPRAG